MVLPDTHRLLSNARSSSTGIRLPPRGIMAIADDDAVTPEVGRGLGGAATGTVLAGVKIDSCAGLSCTLSVAVPPRSISAMLVTLSLIPEEATTVTASLLSGSTIISSCWWASSPVFSLSSSSPSTSSTLSAFADALEMGKSKSMGAPRGSLSFAGMKYRSS